jgi:hypothetical protein
VRDLPIDLVPFVIFKQLAAPGETGSQFFGAKQLDRNGCLPVGREPGAGQIETRLGLGIRVGDGASSGEGDAEMKKRLGEE